ncbi:tripartite motif-containing protein 16-like [Cebidichthys violaceus]|uniref:tripartite motif-containing protein 16-like n=1 Tax=Cebidichthys violaceus TaxID=271503 RepID=UPI0035CB21C2
MELKVQLNRETFSCPICLDLLEDPVTIPCGHSYCMNCIESHFDEEDDNEIHSCPQCRQTFTTRPVLLQNTMLTVLLVQLKKTGLQAAPADHCYAGPEDVACDVCSGRKLKALKSCLICLASYCEQHLRPHYESPAFEKHQLLDPSGTLQVNICSREEEVMKMQCCDNRQCICQSTVSTAMAERTTRRDKIKLSRQRLSHRLQRREKDAKALQRELETVNDSAGKALEESEEISAELIRLVEKRRSDVKREIRSQLNGKLTQITELRQETEHEITWLKRKDAGLKKLSRTNDHNEFQRCYPSLARLGRLKDFSVVNKSHVRPFEGITGILSEVRDKLVEPLREKWTNIPLGMTKADALLPEPEPETRDEFLKHSLDITMDPNTANKQLLLSEGNRKATYVSKAQSYDSHPDRFPAWPQVLSRERLTGIHYWEVESKGKGVKVAVAFKNANMGGLRRRRRFGGNNMSWALVSDNSGYKFMYNKITTPIPGPQSSIIGLYLDHGAGNLSFYSVSDTMTLLHRVKTTFTQPLYAGIGLFHALGVTAGGDSATFCKLK